MALKTVLWTSALTCITLLCSGVKAQPSPRPDAKKLLVLTSESEADEMQALADIMSAHFKDLNATLSLETVSLAPRDIVAQVEAVRALVADRGAFSAIWVERSSEEIFLFVSDNSTQKVFVQTFEDGEQEGWEGACETIAALVRSALITWLEVIPEPTRSPAEPENAPATAPPPKASGEVSEKETPLPKDATPPPSTPATEKKTDEAKIAGRFDLGFAARMIHRSEPWTYNGLLDVGMVINGTFTVAAGTLLGSASDLHIPNVDVVLRTYPIYLKLGLLHRFGKPELSGGCAFVSMITYMDEVSGLGKLKGSTKYEPGMGVFLRFDYRMLPFFSIFALFGADFFFKTVRYNWDGEPVFSFGPTQLYLSVGINFSTL